MPSPKPRYGMWVWAPSERANTATGSTRTSPHRTDQTANNPAVHQSNGRYGFQGSLRTLTP